MQRYLLFDGHCTECSQIARTVRETAGGKIEARSLHDPLMRALVDSDQPDWGTEPLLLEVDDERVRVRAGLAMRIQLLRVLGPGPALRLAERLIRAEPRGIGRRRLLTRIAGLAVLGAGVAALPGMAYADTPGGWVTDPAVLDRLRRTWVAKEATKSFGAPDWDRVYRGGPDNAPYYILSHPNTFTAISDPVTESALGFCYRVRTAAGLPQIDWLRPDNGDHVLRTEIDPGGGATSSTPDGRWARTAKDGVRTGPLAGDPTSPDAWIAFFVCVAGCAAPHIPACGGFCVSCAASGGQNALTCAQCAGCIAGVALGCGMVCFDKFPIPIPTK